MSLYSLHSLLGLPRSERGLVIRLKKVGADDVLLKGNSSLTLAPHRKSISVRGRVLNPIFYHSAKIAAFILLLTAVVSGTSLVGNTVSYYADIERSIGNLLVADPLSFTLTPSNLNVDMSTSSASVHARLIPDATSEPIKYTISTAISGGNETLCSLINVTAPSYGYSGSLLLFSTVATTSLIDIPLMFTFPEGLAPSDNTACFMDLVFIGKNADAAEGRGYTDKHSIGIQFYIPDPSNRQASTTSNSVQVSLFSTTSVITSVGTDSAASTTPSYSDGGQGSATSSASGDYSSSTEHNSGGVGFTPLPREAAPGNIPARSDATSTDGQSAAPFVPVSKTTLIILSDTPTSSGNIVTQPSSTSGEGTVVPEEPIAIPSNIPPAPHDNHAPDQPHEV